jgi:hypothetical protein
MDAEEFLLLLSLFFFLPGSTHAYEEERKFFKKKKERLGSSISGSTYLMLAKPLLLFLALSLYKCTYKKRILDHGSRRINARLKLQKNSTHCTLNM